MSQLPLHETVGIHSQPLTCTFESEGDIQRHGTKLYPSSPSELGGKINVTVFNNRNCY